MLGEREARAHGMMLLAPAQVYMLLLRARYGFNGRMIISLCSSPYRCLLYFQGLPEKEPGEDLGKCCGSEDSPAPGRAAPRRIKPFLDSKGVMLDGVPITLSNFLLHYRDSFIAWIDPHVPKPVGEVLIGLYNQTLDQLEVELDAVKECLEERFSKEMKWVKVILSLKEKMADMEQRCDQKVADLEAELDQSRHAMGKLRESFEDSVKGADKRFVKLKEHFDKASG
jgi:hypothetical protein